MMSIGFQFSINEEVNKDRKDSEKRGREKAQHLWLLNILCEIPITLNYMHTKSGHFQMMPIWKPQNDELNVHQYVILSHHPNRNPPLSTSSDKMLLKWREKELYSNYRGLMTFWMWCLHLTWNIHMQPLSHQMNVSLYTLTDRRHALQDYKNDWPFLDTHTHTHEQAMKTISKWFLICHSQMSNIHLKHYRRRAMRTNKRTIYKKKMNTSKLRHVKRRRR